VTGPIFVRGTEPRDLLAMTVIETLPRVPYGVISNRHGRGALPGEFPDSDEAVSVFAGVEVVDDRSGVDRVAMGTLPRVAGGERTVRFPLAPFLGIIAVAVVGEVRPHSVPPGPHGGNIDINLLTEGTTLHLPVQVPGALAQVGDPHFAQGDGEVALTAMDASLRVTLRFDVAVHNCVRAAIGLLRARYGMDAPHAYAYLSAATDFNISQVVDLVKGVHARIRTADFRS